MLAQIGIILAIVVVFLTMIFWLSGDISERVVKIQNQQRELVARSISLESLSSLKSDAAAAKTLSSLLENILPLKDQLINFPKDMEEIARISGMDFGTSFGDEKSATESEPGYIAFVFTIGGNYEKIVNFMRQAEQSRYIIQWNNVDIAEKSSVYRGTISGRVFSR